MLSHLWNSKKPLAVLGAQWGDEGKGRVVDHLAEHADYVVRFNGGANAGHTIIVDGKKTVTHLLPSGIIREGSKNILGPGVVCSLDVLRQELAIAERCKAQVLLDRSTPIVHSIHQWFDAARESSGGIGTTKRGIGPAYEDMAARRSVRLGDMTNVNKLRKALTDSHYYRERAAASKAYSHIDLPPFPSLDEVIHNIMSYRDDVLPYLCDSREIVYTALLREQKVLFEGGQGVMLDVFGGSAPHTTSSLCTAAGISATFGCYQFGAVIGVSKAYTTRVGDGPFPTELKTDLGDKIRQHGQEFGATTGRPRRCGWLDLIALRYAVRMGGITHLMITKLDTLSVLNWVYACYAYKFENKKLHHSDTLTSRVLREAEPLWSEWNGWNDISHCRKIAELPIQAIEYLRFIKTVADRPILAVGVGPERHQVAV